MAQQHKPANNPEALEGLKELLTRALESNATDKIETAEGVLQNALECIEALQKTPLAPRGKKMATQAISSFFNRATALVTRYASKTELETQVNKAQNTYMAIKP